MQAYLSTLSLVFTTLVSYMGDLITFIMASGHEMILVPFGVILATTAIAELKRIV